MINMLKKIKEKNICNSELGITDNLDSLNTITYCNKEILKEIKKENYE